MENWNKCWSQSKTLTHLLDKKSLVELPAHFFNDETMKEKKRRNKGYSKKKKREVKEKIRELIGRDFSDFETQEKLSLQPHVLQHYKKRIYAEDRMVFENLTAKGVLAFLADKTQENVKALEEVIQVGRKEKKITQAHVSAVRLQHRLEGNMVNWSKKLGLSKKRDREVEVNGVKFEKRTRKSIREAVAHETELMLNDLLW